MKKNVGSTDKMIRFGAVALILILYVTGVIAGGIALLLGIVAFVLLVTGFFGICPLYGACGISTKQSQ